MEINSIQYLVDNKQIKEVHWDFNNPDYSEISVGSWWFRGAIESGDEPELLNDMGFILTYWVDDEELRSFEFVVGEFTYYDYEMKGMLYGPITGPDYHEE